MFWGLHILICFVIIAIEKAFLIEKNQATLSAQSLREQYILRQREKGVEIYEIARNLGLKTMMTLEKYR